jgi:hypothetical protein
LTPRVGLGDGVKATSLIFDLMALSETKRKQAQSRLILLDEADRHKQYLL